MTHFDYAVLAILGLSLAWSLFRGIVREIVSLAGWVGAFTCATLFSGSLASSFPPELGGMLAGLTEVLRSPFLLLICVHVLLLSLTNTFLYFQQASIVAGAFGSQIDTFRAMVLGLIPDCDLDHVQSAGNAAGTGALIALLSRAARGEIERVVREVEKIETAVEPRFQEHFVNAIECEININFAQLGLSQLSVEAVNQRLMRHSAKPEIHVGVGWVEGPHFA